MPRSSLKVIEMPRSPISRVITPVLLAAALATGISFYCFGNVQGVVAFLGGQELILVSESSLEPNDVVNIRIRNLTNTDVSLVGSGSSCSCLKLDELPDVIPALSEIEGRGVFEDPKGKQGPDMVTITVFTSATRTPVLTTQCCNPAARR